MILYHKVNAQKAFLRGDIDWVDFQLQWQLRGPGVIRRIAGPLLPLSAG